MREWRVRMVSLSLSRKDRLSCKRRMKERCEKVSAKGLEGVGEGRGIATRGEVRRCGVRGVETREI